MMNGIIALAGYAQTLLDKVRNSLEFVGPVLLRLYLVSVFWVAGNNKWNPLDEDSSLDSVIEWFGNAEWGLGLPFPALNAYLSLGRGIFRRHTAGPGSGNPLGLHPADGDHDSRHGNGAYQSRLAGCS